MCGSARSNSPTNRAMIILHLLLFLIRTFAAGVKVEGSLYNLCGEELVAYSLNSMTRKDPVYTHRQMLLGIN
jgi:hypothetical protein